MKEAEELVVIISSWRNACRSCSVILMRDTSGDRGEARCRTTTDYCRFRRFFDCFVWLLDEMLFIEICCWGLAEKMRVEVEEIQYRTVDLSPE